MSQNPFSSSIDTSDEESPDNNSNGSSSDSFSSTDLPPVSSCAGDCVSWSIFVLKIKNHPLRNINIFELLPKPPVPLDIIHHICQTQALEPAVVPEGITKISELMAALDLAPGPV